MAINKFILTISVLITIVHVSYEQRRTTTAETTTTITSIWSETSFTSTTSRSSSTKDEDDILHYIVNRPGGGGGGGGGSGSSSSRRPSTSTQRPLPDLEDPLLNSFVDGARGRPSSVPTTTRTTPPTSRTPTTTRSMPSWQLETPTTTTQSYDWSNNFQTTTTRRTFYSTTTRRSSYYPPPSPQTPRPPPPPSAPSVNLTATDSKLNTFVAKWNASSAKLNVRNIRQLTLQFTCNASYPIEWLSQTGFEPGTWGVDEIRHFQEIHLQKSTIVTTSSWLPTPNFLEIKTKTIVTYSAILTLTFEKSDSVPGSFELNCARTGRTSPHNGKQTVIQVVKDSNLTLHLHVSKDVQIWPPRHHGNPENPSGSQTNKNIQFRDPLGSNIGCSVDLQWHRNAFICTSEKPSNLTIDFDEKYCYDFASCERIYSHDTCWDVWVWRNAKSIQKGQLDMWTESTSPPAAVVFCQRDEDKSQKARTDAIHFFHSLPVICPEDDSSTRHQLHIASRIPIEKDVLSRDFVSFCWTPRSYNSSLQNDTKPLVVYSGENITVTCIASLYHFATGTRIGIVTNSNHQKILEYSRVTDASSVVTKIQGCLNFTAKVHVNSPNVSELFCENYLKQSTESVQKRMQIMVKIPRNITFPGALKNLAKWNYSGQPGFVLFCIADGDPEPIIKWNKQGGPIPELIQVVTVNRSSSILKFPTLQEDAKNGRRKASSFSISELHGTYTCEAENRLETRTTTFHVEPTNSSTDNIPVVIIDASPSVSDASSESGLWVLWIILPIIAVIVVAIIAFLIWKIKRQSQELRLLSKAEVDEFLFGKPEFLQHHSSSEEVNNYAPYLPYNKGYEVAKEQLEIDENAVLGSGAYAIVLRGFLTKKIGGDRVKVAIKTARTMDDISYFKALLSELKIMGFIGTHPNIVNLMGAHTKNIQNREIFIAIEFCENGNLLAYLRDHRNRITNLVKVNENGDYDFFNCGLAVVSRESFIGPESGLNTVTLIKWAYEVASGMEFLSQKKVIHGDLAARNILLNEYLVAKIGDFGLSRQLTEYANYIKKQQSPLPWKWLAVECLQDMNFSVKSDVWAYSILLFEIFSLGQVPYPGHSYNDEFLEALVGGKRPGRPSHATSNVYSFMMTCWQVKPEDRPNFNQVREFFNKLLSSLVPQEYLDLHEKVVSSAPSVDIPQVPPQSPNAYQLTNTMGSLGSGSGSLGKGVGGKQGRLSFKMNPKTITAVFHRS